MSVSDVYGLLFALFNRVENTTRANVSYIPLRLESERKQAKFYCARYSICCTRYRKVTFLPLVTIQIAIKCRCHSIADLIKLIKLPWSVIVNDGM